MNLTKKLLIPVRAALFCMTSTFSSDSEPFTTSSEPFTSNSEMDPNYYKRKKEANDRFLKKRKN